MIHKYVLKKERAEQNEEGKKDGGRDRGREVVNVWAEEMEKIMIRAKQVCWEKDENNMSG